MGKFKVGDRVRCIDDRETSVVSYGKEYEVASASSSYVQVIVNGEPRGMYPRRFELVPAITIEPGKHYRLRNGKVTGRVSIGDIGLEAIVDGQVKVFDKAGGAVFGGEDIVEAWVPKVGERVVEAAGEHYDLVKHWRDYWQRSEGKLTDKSFVVTKITGEQVHYSNRAGGAGPQIEVRFLEPLPVDAPAQPLRIQQGKFYKTRDGRKVGPMSSVPWGGFYDDSRAITSQRWEESGSFIKGRTSNFDIIAEWVDEPAAVTASNDNMAQAKFKVGDTVRATETSGGRSVVAGDVVVLTSVDDDYVRFENPRTGRTDGWQAHRFELVTSQPAIVALIEDGAAKPSSKPKVHDSQAEATAEAERLALAHPGQLFGVFVLADSKIADVVNVPTPVLRAA